MTERGVSPEEEMANPQGMKVFAVERRGLPEDLVYFPALCGVQSIVATRICFEPVDWGSARRYFQHAHFIPIVGVGKRGEY